MTLEYDPLSIRWKDDPYPIYRRLRDEAPVFRAPDSGIYCVSRFEDVNRVLNDPETFSSRAMYTVLMMGGTEAPPLRWQTVKSLLRFAIATRARPLAFMKARNLIASDGAAHGELRKIVNRGFTPRRIAALGPRIDTLVAECLAGLHAGRPFDVVRDLATPLPVTIIAEMLGVPPERSDDFKRWSDGVIHFAAGPGRDEGFGPEFTTIMVEFLGFLRQIVKQRRADPQDDLVSTLVASQDGEDGLTDYEVMLFVQLLLVAGNETTTNLIGNATCALLDHRDQLERVAADLSLVPGAIEETLRYDTPIQLVFRNTTREAEIAGTRIPKGAFVAVLLGSANRDERRFADADRFDVTRDVKGHLGFGFGAHFCLGASLARLEAKSALEALVPALPQLHELDDARPRVDSFLVRGPTRLPLAPAA
jgi:cytochrome P450